MSQTNRDYTVPEWIEKKGWFGSKWEYIGIGKEPKIGSWLLRREQIGPVEFKQKWVWHGPEPPKGTEKPDYPYKLNNSNNIMPSQKQNNIRNQRLESIDYEIQLIKKTYENELKELENKYEICKQFVESYDAKRQEITNKYISDTETLEKTKSDYETKLQKRGGKRNHRTRKQKATRRH